MVAVFLSIGSNVEREHNIRGAVAALRSQFDDLIISTVYRTRAVGFDGEDFYNLAAGFSTDLPVAGLVSLLRGIESRHGRRRDQARYSPRTLDLDLLLYGDLVSRENGIEVPRGEIVHRAFVLGPLAEIAARRRHPVTEQTIGELWRAFPGGAEQLEKVSFRP